AVAAIQAALVELPQDWRSWYRLARACWILGRDGQARQAADTVDRIRAVLDPGDLGPRIESNLGHLDDPAALRDWAALVERVGLKRLSEAWRTEAHNLPNPGHAR